MTSHVQKLAEAPCPECKGMCPNCTPELIVNPDGDCLTCHGTGALVPGLRRECWNHFVGQVCPRDTCSVCQGRGWTLIPETEQVSILNIALLEIVGEYTIGKTGVGPKFEQGHRGFYVYSEDFNAVIEGDTPEEILAYAVGQVHGVQGVQ